jgi:hypothetical protein
MLAKDPQFRKIRIHIPQKLGNLTYFGEYTHQLLRNVLHAVRLYAKVLGTHELGVIEDASAGPFPISAPVDVLRTIRVLSSVETSWQ